MMRTVLVALTIGAAALLGTAATVAAAESPVPQSVGMLPAAEAPAPVDDSPVAPLLQVTGVTLLLAGGLVMARSWVSPKETV